MASNIDPNFITTDPVPKAGMITQLEHARDEITALQAADSGKFDKTGGTLTGSVIVNAANPNVELRKTASGQGNYITGATGALKRWLLTFGDGTAEAGLNAGSNLSLDAYNDAGSYLGNIFNIIRSTRVLSFNVSPTAPTPSVGTNSTQLATTAFVHSRVPMIFKYGTGTVTMGSTTITFSPAFPTSCFGVQVTVNGGTTPFDFNPLLVGTPTTSSCAVYGAPGDTLGFNWIAYGN